MRLSEICIQRPVFALMLIMFLVVMGVFSFMGLGVDLFPKSDVPTVNVRINLPGASPEEMVSQVVLPMEEAIASVAGIDELVARVTEGNANIQINFVLDRNIAEAVNDVREKVSSAQRKLPPNTLAPTVTKSDLDADSIMRVALSGQRPIRDLTELADKTVRRSLETVDGVGIVDIQGGRNRQINVYMDIDKMNAYGLSGQQVQSSVMTENVEAPGGRIVKGLNEMGVRTLGRVESIHDFDSIIVKNVNGSPIRIRDIGKVEDGMSERRSFAYYKGTPAVLIEIRRQTGVNTVKVVDSLTTRIEELQRQLPPGVKLDIISEQATYIRASVAALEEHLVLGSLLASLIIWIFIRDWRTVFISSIAIPTSIITTFTVLKVLDFTLNSMTLLGLTLAVGIVIDDAIIVIENIYRVLNESDMEPAEATLYATKEIALAVLATTLSLVIVFIPIAFISGYAKRYLNEFGWTMAVSILVSMLVAFTLTPALAARMLKKAKKGVQAAGAHHRGWMEALYERSLVWSLNHRTVILAISLLTLGSTYFLYDRIGKDWMPQEDQNELGVFIETAEGTSLEGTEKVALALSKKFEAIDGVTAVVPSTAGFLQRVTMAYIYVFLKPQDQRGSITEMGQKVRDVAKEFAFARPRVTFPNILGGRDSFAPIRMQLLGPDINKLVVFAKQLNAEMAKEPSIVDIKVNLNLNNPELQVKIDRGLASDLGVRVSDVADSVRLLMSGEDQISTFKEDAEQYPVMMRLLPHQRDDRNVLSRLLVPSAKGLIRLDSVASLSQGLGPSRIDRYNRQFSVGVYGNVALNSSLGVAAAAAASALDRVALPPGYRVAYAGQVKVLEETTKNMLLAIGLASIFMYMVLAAQFESLVHPLIILSTLPLSIPFALLSLIVTGRTMNLFSALGILLLLGIVKKNGILQIDYMNRLRDQGQPLLKAIIEANSVRLRPILMTTLSIVAGLIPTAIGVGAGAGQRSAIAITIIGGQMLCLLLTLLVVPVGYAAVEDLKAWYARRSSAGLPATAGATGD
ncbi:efflux RND transporter permease subunit [Bryobacter aggregatus]|uniref:efflux RND transporter permease subunit n=1 Tax=Bryobacter aggregatus TaxID=360054 RepID=UPI0012BA9118|nr:efflux RND transporter permease subunit [Bryobacter aggregatus]